MKVYADTSVFGGVFDEEFSEPTKQFFSEIDAGRFVIVTSAVVESEIEPAPKNIRDFSLIMKRSLKLLKLLKKCFSFNSNILFRCCYCKIF